MPARLWTAVVALLVAAGPARGDDAARALSADLPLRRSGGGYITSAKCRDCHLREHRSWSASYHSTMTRPATSTSVLGEFDGVQLAARDSIYNLEQRGDAFQVRVSDPSSGATLRTARIVMTTGSHHMQVYWLRGERGQFVSLPFLYLIAERRWIPREDAFLRPADMGPIGGVWNDNCIDCHSVGGQPRLAPQTGAFQTRVAELGVACEACHGPGEEHARLMRESDPASLDGRLAIVHPARVSPRAASQICGQCHGVTFVKDASAWRRDGFRYRPGDDLEVTRFVPRPWRDRERPWFRRLRTEWPTFVEEHFWPDGAVRVSGREYNGLIDSACHVAGGLSCLSCHSMHRSDPDDQLAAGKAGNEACLPCHEDLRERLGDHTHHPPDSNGSLCYNCHMPHTTYGLLKAMRSHRIDNPSVERALRSGRPDACSLCHLDRSLDWTARHLTAWYGAPVADLTGEQRSTSAALLWLLSGDAGQRALVAWSMGWEPALETAGRGWEAPFLALLLDDPYSAVRFLAWRALRRLPGYEGFKYDFVGSPRDRTGARKRALEIWKGSARADRARAGASVLMLSPGVLDEPAVERLLKSRDDRRLYLAE